MLYRSYATVSYRIKRELITAKGRTMGVEHIFVYGTLMQGMNNYHLIEKHVKSVSPGLLTGELYHLPYGYPALREGLLSVRGEIIALDSSMCEALPILDNLEGYLGPGHADNLYVRVIRKARKADGETVDVYVYLWAKPEELEGIGEQISAGCWRSFMSDARSEL